MMGDNKFSKFAGLGEAREIAAARSTDPQEDLSTKPQADLSAEKEAPQQRSQAVGSLGGAPSVDFSLDDDPDLKTSDLVPVTMRTLPGNRDAIKLAALLRRMSVNDLIKEAIAKYLSDI